MSWGSSMDDIHISFANSGKHNHLFVYQQSLTHIAPLVLPWRQDGDGGWMLWIHSQRISVWEFKWGLVCVCVSCYWTFHRFLIICETMTQLFIIISVLEWFWSCTSMWNYVMYTLRSGSQTDHHQHRVFSPVNETVHEEIHQSYYHVVLTCHILSQNINNEFLLFLIKLWSQGDMIHKVRLEAFDRWKQWSINEDEALLFVVIQAKIKIKKIFVNKSNQRFVYESFFCILKKLFLRRLTSTNVFHILLFVEQLTGAEKPPTGEPDTNPPSSSTCASAGTDAPADGGSKVTTQYRRQLSIKMKD